MNSTRTGDAGAKTVRFHWECDRCDARGDDEFYRDNAGVGASEHDRVRHPKASGIVAQTVVTRGNVLMSVQEHAVLEFLDAHPQGVSASLLGAHLWGRHRKGHVVASHGGGDYAAQMLLGRMRKKGLVCVLRGEGSSLWGAA